MLKNYFKVAYRSLVRDKFFSILNILGLTVGVSAFLLITLFVRHELSFDQFHTKGDRIYTQITIYHTAEGPKGSDVSGIMAAKTLNEHVPEIENYAQLSFPDGNLVAVGENSFYEEGTYYASNDLFEIFDFPIIEGQPDLASPLKAVITEDIAIKYFGQIDVIGKIILLNKKDQYEVSAVVANPPKNSYIQFSILLSEYGLFESINARKTERQKWSRAGYTYYLLGQGVEEATAIKKMNEAAEQYFPAHLRTDAGEMLFDAKLMAYEDIHLRSGFKDGLSPTGDIRYVYLFSAIAVLILIIACVNYINLSTAKSLKRIKETGLRKVIGANRMQLMKLYLSESFVLTSISVVLAFAIAERVLPYYNQLIERELVLNYGGVEFVFTIIVINVLVSLMAGAYPAFKLSSYKPSEALRGAKSPKGKKTLRRSLVLFQFLVAQLLIIATIVIQSQLSYLQNKDLGYNREHALYIRTYGEMENNADVFKERLKAIPTVQKVAKSDGVFTLAALTFFKLKDVEGNEDADANEYIIADVYHGDEGFLDLLEIEILQGRGFDKANSSDAKEGIIINEAAVIRFGWVNPIGKKLDVWGTRYVVGVMKDFHNESLRAEITPIFVTLDSETSGYINLRISPENMSATLKQVEAEWNKLAPDRPFDYTFYDDKFDQHYKSEMRLGDIFVVFASIAIGISLLGLVGLTAFSAEQRLKEMGIRKVLGASVKQLMMLLSKEFVVMSGVAFVVAVPITYYVMEGWLEVFKYRIEIGVLVYGIAILSSIGVACLVVSFQSFKVANTNPSDVLRME